MKSRTNRSKAPDEDPAQINAESFDSAHSLLEQGHLQPAAQALLGIIERMLRATIKVSLSVLGDEERLRIQKIETEIGNSQKGIEKFTFGELVGLVRRSGFFEILENHRQTHLTRAKTIDWGELVKLRNRITHDGAAVTRENTVWLLETTRALGEEFGLLASSTLRNRGRWLRFDTVPILLVAAGCAFTAFEFYKTLYGPGGSDPETEQIFPAINADLPELHNRQNDPANATLSRPYLNGLGMAFVPINGLEILVARHETTVSDFRKFQKATSLTMSTGSSWDNPGFSQTEKHPVVLVSWNDANAFCLWLTEMEGLKYRLPTDAEWSVASGSTGDREMNGTNPEEKNRRLPDYPWGSKDYPPPAKFANFGIPGADDGFEFTAPVGSYLPNENGLFDMAGNVWEWCADSYSDTKPHLKVLRGNSWENYSGPSLVNSAREPSPPEVRSKFYGFRVVLDLK